MTKTLTIERLPETQIRPRRSGLAVRVPAIASLVSKAFARHAINGALKALNAPGNPFTTDSL